MTVCYAFENMTNIINELQRRSVFRVAAAYLAIAWLTLQILDNVKGLLNLPQRVGLYSLVALGIGFPVAMFLAWAYFGSIAVTRIGRRCGPSTLASV